jgi:long-chain acyl-CoA synthetase
MRPLHEHIRDHAQATPDKPAIIYYGSETSYVELDRLSDACAVLLEELGVHKGDRVALFMQNCPQYIIAHLGIQKLGAVVSPCSPLFKTQELRYQLDDMEAEVVIAADTLHPVVRSVGELTHVGRVLLVSYQDFVPSSATYPVPDEVLAPRAIPDSDMDFLARIQGPTAAPGRTPRDVAMDDLALLVYTSGTTGRPKGAMLTHDNVMFKTDSTVRFMQILRDDVHLVIPPLYHISGMLCGLDIPLFCGGTLVLHYRFNAMSALASIERHRVTYWKSIAPMLVAAMNEKTPRHFDLTSLRITTATSFGVRTTPAMSRQWAQFSGGCEVTESAYGLTETHTFDAIMPRDAVRWETTGKIVPNVRCRIVDPATGRDLPVGEQGEIVLRSPGNFRGYWRQPEKTRESLRDGWVHTGDIGKLDAEEYLTLLGRMKELIKVSGYSVFPEDVEALLMMHPHVELAAVVGVPDPQKGEAVHAFVVPRSTDRPRPTEAELIAWCRESMSAYKVPRSISFRSQLPQTASGKVIRRELVADAERDRGELP